jgi:hypothetical protein
MAVSSGSAPGVEGSRLVESRAGDISLAGVAAIGAVIPCSGVGSSGLSRLTSLCGHGLIGLSLLQLSSED